MQLFEITTFHRAANKVSLYPKLAMILISMSNEEIKMKDLIFLTGYSQMTLNVRLRIMITHGFITNGSKFGYYRITDKGIKRVADFRRMYAKFINEREGLI